MSHRMAGKKRNVRTVIAAYTTCPNAKISFAQSATLAAHQQLQNETHHALPTPILSA
jgi:hypothetical protein